MRQLKVQDGLLTAKYPLGVEQKENSLFNSQAFSRLLSPQ